MKQRTHRKCMIEGCDRWHDAKGYCGMHYRRWKQYGSPHMVGGGEMHGLSGTKIYYQWSNMHRRCYEKGHPRYADWGGRGIRVCERWHSLANFYADMGDKPEGMTLERIDNDGDYDPDNCEWATHVKQGRNKRNNVTLTLNGVTRCASEWAEVTGMHRMTIMSRINRYGWSIERALTEDAVRGKNQYS